MHLSFILFFVSFLIVMTIRLINPMDKPYQLPEAHLVEMTPWKYRKGFSYFLIAFMAGMYLVFSPAVLVNEPIEISWGSVAGWSTSAVMVYSICLFFFRKFKNI